MQRLTGPSASRSCSGDRIVVINITRSEPRLDTGFARGNHVQSLSDRLDNEGIEYEVRQVMGENVADAVLFEAEQAGASSIAIGIRRRSPVGKILMGSVAQQILLDATVPVVAVKP
ncbi:universal stress protein [Aeromicrobium sp. UC242_57]|uniref:universal stress protein n=1 Tax=Aeromicrobium sp. UC242_57 TaxID=3374624 RepID=UPI0037B8B4F8